MLFSAFTKAYNKQMKLDILYIQLFALVTFIGARAIRISIAGFFTDLPFKPTDKLHVHLGFYNFSVN